MKKALSLILTVAMLLSVAVVATVSPSATDGENLFYANQEVENKSWSSIPRNQYAGIKLDGDHSDSWELTPSTTDIKDGVKIGEIDIQGKKVQFGASYSGATGSSDGANKAYSLHLLVYNLSSANITSVAFTTGDKTLTYWKDTSMTSVLKNGDVWDNNTKVTTWKNRNTFIEIELPLSYLNLKNVYSEKDLSTDLTITLTTDLGGVQTLAGRLVLVMSSQVAALKSSPNVASGTAYNAGTKTVTLNHVPNGTAPAVYSSANDGTVLQATTWDYSATVNVTSMPALQENAPVICYTGGSSLSASATPGISIAVNDGPTKTKGAVVHIYNYDGILHIATTANSVNLGVGLNTPFDLNMSWNTDQTWDIYVNGISVGKLQGSKGNDYTGNATATTVFAQGVANSTAIAATIENFVITMVNDALAADLLAHSATHYVPAIKFYQTTDVVGGTYNLRLVATIDKALVDSGVVTAAGFEIAASKTNAQGTVNGAAKKHYVTEVYESITADGQNVQAPDGTYFIIFTVKEIPAADTLTLNFSAFAETEAEEYAEGNVFTMTFENGVRKN